MKIKCHCGLVAGAFALVLCLMSAASANAQAAPAKAAEPQAQTPAQQAFVEANAAYWAGRAELNYVLGVSWEKE